MIKFNDAQFEAAAAQVDEILKRIPGVARSAPLSLMPGYMSWVGPRFEAETTGGTIRYFGEIEVTHIRIKAVVPSGFALPDPFVEAIGPVPGPETLMMAHLSGRSMTDPVKVAEFLEAAVEAIGSVMLARDLPAPKREHPILSKLNEAFRQPHPLTTTAFDPGGSFAMFAAMIPVNPPTDSQPRAAREDDTRSLASRVALLADELCTCTARYSEKDYADLIVHASEVCTRMLTIFGPNVRSLASDRSASRAWRASALRALHSADELARCLDLQISITSSNDVEAVSDADADSDLVADIGPTP